jgi:negative regulator of sigma-B (phosphoserine phosphatase)
MTDAVEWLSIPRSGETETGDLVIVRTEDRRTMFAVVDALGHGRHAARVAAAAARYLQSAPLTGGALRVMEGLHECLRATRGAAALICIVSANELEGCAVGNVEMRCEHARVPIMLTPGILGGRLKRPRAFGGTLPIKDRLVIFTDGVSARFSLRDVHGLSPADACRAILERGRRTHDDATVLVADLGSRS